MLQKGLWALVALALVGCTGPAGSDGAAGQNGEAGALGTPGEAGAPGAQGDAGASGRNAFITGANVRAQITGAQLASPGGASTVTFKLTDGAGKPLDMNGVYSPGTYQVRFILGRLNSGTTGKYTNLTTYVSDAGATPVPSYDRNGTYDDLGDGVYVYHFGKTDIDLSDLTKTHTVAMTVRRTLDGVNYVANATYNFVPNGSPVTATRSVVKTASCNQCHTPLLAHGTRAEVNLCVLCHTNGVTDPSNATQSIDFRDLAHGIHMGARLPSVVAGGTFKVNGADFSTVKFPQDQRNCNVCHASATPYVPVASIANCVSCHNLTSWESPTPAGKRRHMGGAPKTDAQCNECHAAGMDYGTDKVHYSLDISSSTPAILDPAAPAIAFQNVSASYTAASSGQLQVSFKLVDKTGTAVAVLNPDGTATGNLSRLVVNVGGPTTDYAAQMSITIPTAANTSTPGLVAGVGGGYVYTISPNPLPVVTATDPQPTTGTYAVGLEAQWYRSDGAIITALNPVTYFSLDGAPIVPRRQVVDRTKCNSCHFDFGRTAISGKTLTWIHGGRRNNPEYCVMCHNPNRVNAPNIYAVPASPEVSVNFKVLIHKIHMGEKLTQGYMLGGNPALYAATKGDAGVGTYVFSNGRYPGNQAVCWACHVETSYFASDTTTLGRLETKSNIAICYDSTDAGVVDAAARCSDAGSARSPVYTPPLTSACTACHDSPSATSHAYVNTQPGSATINGKPVEACATCHRVGAIQDVQAVHVKKVLIPNISPTP